MDTDSEIYRRIHFAVMAIESGPCKLGISGKELLTHTGCVSAEVAKLKANEEYDKFRERTQYQLSPVEIHFIEAFEAEQKKLRGNKNKF